MTHHTKGQPMRHIRGTTIAVASLLVLTLAACADEPPDPGPRFDDESTSRPGDLTCMKHQAEPPGLRYTDKSRRRTDDTLAMLRYYTANGAKPYCDDNKPTATDRAWLQLYVDLGADRDNIAALLDNTG